MKAKKIFLGVIILVFLLQSMCLASPNIKVKGKNYKGIILVSTETKFWKPDWTPTRKVISELEAKLRPYLVTRFIPNIFNKREYRPKYAYLIFVLKNLKSYERQYLGKIVNKKKLIYCSFVLYNGRNLDIKKYWDKDFMDVSDGGPYYFYVTYNVSSKKFSDLFINGM